MSKRPPLKSPSNSLLEGRPGRSARLAASETEKRRADSKKKDLKGEPATQR